MSVPGAGLSRSNSGTNDSNKRDKDRSNSYGECLMLGKLVDEVSYSNTGGLLSASPNEMQGASTLACSRNRQGTIVYGSGPLVS